MSIHWDRDALRAMYRQFIEEVARRLPKRGTATWQRPTPAKLRPIPTNVMPAIWAATLKGMR